MRSTVQVATAMHSEHLPRTCFVNAAQHSCSLAMIIVNDGSDSILEDNRVCVQ
jgi:hypothetical protein